MRWPHDREMKALYFPDLSLPDLSWTNPVILYFDKVGIIGPGGYNKNLSNTHTADLVTAGLVEPLFGGIFGDYREEDGFLLECIEIAVRQPPGEERYRSTKPYLLHAGSDESDLRLNHRR